PDRTARRGPRPAALSLSIRAGPDRRLGVRRRAGAAGGEGAVMDAVPAASDLGSARRAVTAAFGANGLLIASLAVRTPSLQQDLHLDPGRLGLAAALFGVAAVLAMQTAGGLAARFGS